MGEKERGAFLSLLKELNWFKPICNYCGTFLKESFTCPSCRVDNSDDYQEYIKYQEDIQKLDEHVKESDQIWLKVSIDQFIKRYNKKIAGQRENVGLQV